MKGFLRGVLVGVVGTGVLTGGVVLAGSGVGGIFNLGQNNAVDATTQLAGTTTGGPQLSVTNLATGGSSAGIQAISKSAAATLLGVNQGSGPSFNGVADSVTAGAFVTNNGTGPGIRINTSVGAPLVVTSSAKVDNLNVDRIDGLDSTAFVGDTLTRRESPPSTGTLLSDGTRYNDQSCNAGEVMLSGGPANVDNGTVLLESFPIGTHTWRARISNNGTLDSFNVVVLCARR